VKIERGLPAVDHAFDRVNQFACLEDGRRAVGSKAIGPDGIGKLLVTGAPPTRTLMDSRKPASSKERMVSRMNGNVVVNSALIATMSD